MSLSDCAKCWDTPCECGWEYRHWSIDRLERQAELFRVIAAYKKEHPKAKFSSVLSDPTPDDNDLYSYLMENIKSNPLP